MDRSTAPPSRAIAYGHSLTYRLVGQGSPTIILETGLGAESAEWDAIASQLGRTTRVLRYDRLGRGDSDPATGARGTAEMVADLHALLAAIGVDGPYVLVGHSFGGLLVRAFADTCRDQIAGMVLVEAMHRENFDRLGPLFPDPTPEDPPKLKEMRSFWRSGSRDPAETPEQIDFEASFALDARIKSFTNFPLRVITADPFLHLPFIKEEAGQRMQAEWLALQKQLLRFATDAEQVRAEGSGHFVQRDKPEVVVETLARLLNPSAFT